MMIKKILGTLKNLSSFSVKLLMREIHTVQYDWSIRPVFLLGFSVRDRFVLFSNLVISA